MAGKAKRQRVLPRTSRNCAHAADGPLKAIRPADTLILTSSQKNEAANGLNAISSPCSAFRTISEVTETTRLQHTTKATLR